jgi:hypothetical protein
MSRPAGEQTATVLIARCENLQEPDGAPCPGRLTFRWGQSDAACDTCGARCGVAVAAWLAVQPDVPALGADLRERACFWLYPGLPADEAYRRHPQQIDRVAATLAQVTTREGTGP